MNLKILFILLGYYAIISLFFIFAINAGSFEATQYSYSASYNATDISTSELDKGGLFATGVSFGRFISLVTIGIGLPENTPTGFSVIFSAWQTIILIFTIGFIIASIWNG